MKVDVLHFILPITLLVLIVIAFHKPQQKIVVREVVDSTPAPYYTFAFPNYWEWPGRDNTYYNPYLYDPYFIYPYSIGPWWYGVGGYSGGYSGGIRTGGGSHYGGGGHGGGGHGGGGHGGGGGGHH